MNKISKKSSLKGSIRVSGSKSHTIRAVLLATMAEGRSVISNPLQSLDCKSSLAAAKAFGAHVEQNGDQWVVEGVGRNLSVPGNYLDCGNSGSVAYFATPMAGMVDGYTYVTGDEQIRRRPIKLTVDAINALGGFAQNVVPGSEACPVLVHGMMKGGTARFNGQLSQLISGIMMVAPLLENDTNIVVDDPHEKPYLQITLDWMKRYGIIVGSDDDFHSFSIKGKQAYKPCNSTIPADWSSVAFPLVAGIITPDSEIEIDALDFNDSQGDKMVVDYMMRMGANIKKDLENGSMSIKSNTSLKSGLTINMSDIPDSLPALSVAALFAEGDTKFTGLAHVRMKETDRVAVMAEELSKLGASIEIGSDYMIVHGNNKLHGGKVSSHGDHRVAMALLVCGLGMDEAVEVENSECAAVSFPSFFEVMKKMGADIATCDK